MNRRDMNWGAINRRDCLKITGAAAVLPFAPAVARPQSAPGPCTVQVGLKRLMLRHTWTTTMSSSEYRDTVQVEYQRDGVSGHGEGAPIMRYQEFPASAMKAIEAIATTLPRAIPGSIRNILRASARRWATSSTPRWLPSISPSSIGWARSSVCRSTSFSGWIAADAPITDFSIGIDTPEITRQKTREAEDFPILKVKVGLKTDEATIEAVRSVTKKPIRVDANEGWTDKEEAIRKINWLETQGVEYVEQPMPAHMVEETKYVRSKVHLPIYADEACTEVSNDSKTRRRVRRNQCEARQSRRHSGVAALDPGGARHEHEGHARLHGFQFLLGHGRGALFAAGGLRRSRWEPAGGERSLARRAGGKRKTAAS